MSTWYLGFGTRENPTRTCLWYERIASCLVVHDPRESRAALDDDVAQEQCHVVDHRVPERQQPACREVALDLRTKPVVERLKLRVRPSPASPRSAPVV